MGIEKMDLMKMILNDSQMGHHLRAEGLIILRVAQVGRPMSLLQMNYNHRIIPNL
jgi:hypothetical protein